MNGQSVSVRNDSSIFFYLGNVNLNHDLKYILQFSHVCPSEILHCVVYLILFTLLLIALIVIHKFINVSFDPWTE